MAEQVKNIPKLRFPEFVNDGEWKETKLGEEVEFYKGKGLPKKKIVANGKYPCIHYGELFTIYPAVIHKVKSFTNQKKGVKSEYGDVLMPTSDVTPNGLATASCLKTSNVILGGDILIIRSNKDKIEGEFLSRFINANKNRVLRFVTGTTVYHLYSSTFNKFKILYSSLNEQQKIADCLSSLDDLITAHKEKLDVLKEHKKGLLQNLFPQEGEKIPKYRFPEFENDGDWEEKKLKSLGKFQGGGTPSKKKKNYWVGDIPWISSSDVYDNDIFNISITRYINEESIQNSATKLIPEDSVLFVSRVGVGKFVVNEKPVCTSQDFTNFTPKKINSYFVAYSFLANKNKLVALVQGTSIKGFTTKDLKKTEILVPNKLMEQQKIAETLSSLDSIIEQQQKKIEELEEHKKGLLQGLFPEMKN